MKGARSIFALLMLAAHGVYFLAHPQDSADEPIKLSTDLVVCDAQVLNKKTGRSVGNLRKEDFALYEDGRRQYITHFSQDRLPLSVILLLDTSGSIWPYINELRKSAAQALQRLKPVDEVALMVTASRTELIQDFTRDRERLSAQLNSFDEKAFGEDGILLHEALYQAAVRLNKSASPSSRRVIIAVTDNLSTQYKKSQGHSEQEALYELFESGGVVCGLLVGKYAHRDKMDRLIDYDPIGMLMTKVFFKDPGHIVKYANETGGLVLKTDKENIAVSLAELIDQLRARYSFGYVSSNQKWDGKFRKIKLEVSREVKKRVGEVAIITRKGYYARKRAATTNDSPEKAPAKP